MKNIKKLKRKVSCSCATRLVVLFLLLSVVNFESVGQETDEPNDFRVTKGRYFGSLTFSLDQREAENEDQLLRYVIDQDRLNYRIPELTFKSICYVWIWELRITFKLQIL
jgi:hypothetical protein